MTEEKVTIEGESIMEEKSTMERGTPMENEMNKGGLEDTEGSEASNKVVKSGFLNKKSMTKSQEMTKNQETAKKKEDGFLLRMYQRTIGPNSIARKLLPLAKNYIIFFGAVTLMHFRSQDLDLPPPI